MNFNIDCQKLFGSESDGISIIEPSQKKYLKVFNYLQVCEIIDAIGISSANHRGLKLVITSSKKFFEDPISIQDKIFIKVKGNTVIGFLRIGPRSFSIPHEKNIQSLIDFYIHSAYQKKGEGKKLFDKMLKFMNLLPHHIAYQNPNSKFLSFMIKHYSLINYIKQNNNLIIYDNFFRRDNRSKDNTEKMTESNEMKRSFYLKQAADSIMNRNQLDNHNKYNKLYSPARQENDKDNFYLNSQNIIDRSIDDGNNSINLLNSNVDKRFFNYYFNNNIKNNHNEMRTNSSSKIQNITPNDKEEFEKKFDPDLYLKNLIKDSQNVFNQRNERLKKLNEQIYRNPIQNFFEYKKNNEYATVFDNTKKVSYR